MMEHSEELQNTSLTLDSLLQPKRGIPSLLDANKL